MSKKKKRNVKRRKKHLAKPQVIGRNVLDFHHYAYIARNWNQGWAKALRSHPYVGAYIPKFTLHKSIHAQIWTIPVPDGHVCKMILDEINQGLERGALSPKDSPTTKMHNLIEICEKYDKKTAAALREQEAIMLEFYSK